MKNIVMGIDPGLYKSGYAFVENKNQKFSLLDAGVVFTPAADPIEERLFIIYQSFSQLIEEFKPQEIFIEKLFFSKNKTSALNVSKSIGVMLLLFRQKKIPVFEITPVEVKKYITGDYRADKEAVHKSVLFSLGLTSLSGLKDVSDAIGIALSGWYKKREDSYV